jgi:hypothetical protein
MLQGVLDRDPVGAAADDGYQLDLPVGVAVRRQLDVSVGSGDAVGNLVNTRGSPVRPGG